MSDHDEYLDPQDNGILAPVCEDCGQGMEILRRYLTIPNVYKCPNPYCPSKYFGTAKIIANELVAALDTVSTLEARVKYLSNRLKQVDPNWT